MEETSQKNTQTLYFSILWLVNGILTTLQSIFNKKKQCILINNNILSSYTYSAKNQTNCG